MTYIVKAIVMVPLTLKIDEKGLADFEVWKAERVKTLEIKGVELTGRYLNVLSMVEEGGANGS